MSNKTLLLVPTPPKPGMNPILIMGETATIGRVAGESISAVIDHPTVSSRHARLTWNSQVSNYDLTDLQSANGTFVNGHPHRAGLIKEGDRIQFGQVSYMAKAWSRDAAPDKVLPLPAALRPPHRAPDWLLPSVVYVMAFVFTIGWVTRPKAEPVTGKEATAESTCSWKFVLPPTVAAELKDKNSADRMKSLLTALRSTHRTDKPKSKLYEQAALSRQILVEYAAEEGPNALLTAGGTPFELNHIATLSTARALAFEAELTALRRRMVNMTMKERDQISESVAELIPLWAIDSQDGSPVESDICLNDWKSYLDRYRQQNQ